MPIPFEKLTYTDILHHQLAYGCFDEVGKSLFQEWDIVGFEKAVLGCGDNHFLYMAEKIKERTGGNFDQRTYRFRQRGK